MTAVAALLAAALVALRQMQSPCTLTPLLVVRWLISNWGRSPLSALACSLQLHVQPALGALGATSTVHIGIDSKAE